MAKRGGGVKGVSSRIVDSVSTKSQFVVVEVEIDVCDSMGANLVNTVCEGIAPLLEKLTGARAGLKILSNLALNRRAGSSFMVPVEAFKTEKFAGKEVCERVVEAWEFAASDPFRAATHNKGVMNGIDAVAIATGQDWRAINSSAYSENALLGKPRPFTSYKIEEDSKGKEFLVGAIELPIAVGVKGGATQSNPLYQQNLKLLGNPSSAELAQIILSVGLAQNLAALKALSVEGIQRGHMRLHARHIALSAGVPHDFIDAAVYYMQAKKSISAETARDFLIEHGLPHLYTK
jgi:degradative hydroxymethylglutaryl-CoA reductase